MMLMQRVLVAGMVAVFVDCPLADARQRADALRRVIADTVWEDLGAGLTVTIRIGLCDDTALGSMEEMLKCADAMLYQAKERGRNRVEWASPG